MRTLSATLVSLVLIAAAVRAQGGERLLTEAADVLDQETCQKVADRCMQRIEAYTRMKYRRPVRVRIQPRAVWQARLKQQGFGGNMARTGLAFYNLIANNVTVVPWVIGGYMMKSPTKKSREEWIHTLEPILIHELTHAIQNQNFYVVLGGARQASLKSSGLTEEELDISTVEFLVAEGTAELVSARTSSPQGRANMVRHIDREVGSPTFYMNRYKPNGKEPYRILLSSFGYQDGMDLLHHLTLKAGPRGIRAVLYRLPPRVLFFQPDILGEVDLDDPPEPDSILGFLATEKTGGEDVFLAVNPGSGRFFLEARPGPMRQRAAGCLIGFATEVGEEDGPYGHGRYSFFVADPDKPGGWSKEQALSLKALYPSGVKEHDAPLPLAKGVKARVIRMEADDKSLYVRAETNGLVVLAHETKPSSNLEERVLMALRVLYIKRPTPNLYAQATARARAKLKLKD